MNPKYSIVIPTSNNADVLVSCLNSILQFSNLEATEILVVDNGSSDSTAAFCQVFKERLKDNFTYVYLAENQGFCKATNIGMSLSKGDFIVWLNDDTLVTPNWLEELETSITTKHVYHSNIGLAGPRSNNAAGAQSIKELAGKSYQECLGALPTLRENVASFTLSTPNGDTYRAEPLTGFLSGFCLMLKREVYTTIGGIDEIYSPGGFCDNDFLVRAITAGYGAVQSQGSFVYHYGSTTLNKLYPELRGGVRNWAKYVAKHRTNKDNKLLLIQRVKIDSDTQLSTYRKCGHVNEKYVDGVIILSDRSTHNEMSEKTCRKIYGKKLLSFVENPKHVPLDEIRDRLALMTMASNLKDKYDWVLVLDHDECFSPETDVNRIKELMNPFNPLCMGYTLYCNNYWRSDTMARVDGAWGTAAYYSRMWKNGIFENTLRPKYTKNDVGFHCGNRPMSIPANMFLQCDLVINHYAYSTPNEIERKYAFYNKNDNSPKETQKYTVGSVDYNHLINEVGIKVIVPRPFSISVNMMVKNEETNIGLQLLNYASIAREFVIADTGSTDKTMEFLDQVGIPYHQIPFEDDFSKIRNKLIDLSKYQYIIHVDGDEIPEKDFLSKIVGMLNTGPDIALCHMRTQHTDGRFQVIKQPRIFKNDGRFYYYGRVHETLDKSLSKVPNFTSQDCELSIFNPGFLTDPETIKRKLEFYGRLLKQEVEDHPDNSKACFELALHYRNFGKTDEAISLLEQSLKHFPYFVRARLELVLINVNRALNELDKCKGMKVEGDVLSVLQQLHTTLSPWEFKPLAIPNE